MTRATETLRPSAFRPLSTFERAMARTQRHAPFNVVMVLTFGSGLALEQVRGALHELGHRHPILLACIQGSGVRQAFAPGPSAIGLTTVAEGLGQESELAGLLRVETELARPFDLAAGPLMHVTAAARPDGEIFQLLLTLPHLIVDASSGVVLIADLLEGLGKPPVAGAPPDVLDEMAAVEVHGPLPDLGARFPQRHRGLPGRLRAARAFLRDLLTEAAYTVAARRRTRLQVPPVATSRALHFELDELETKRLLAGLRRHRLTLASTLASVWAAAYSAWVDHNRGGPVRVFTMADLRRQVRPVVPRTAVGSGWAMMRSQMRVPPEFTTAPAAAALVHLVERHQQRLQHNLLRGDAFTSFRNAARMMAIVLGPVPQRMGELAVSYSGPVALAPRSGLELGGLQAFVSTMDIGPAIVCQHHIWKGRLSCGLVYLESDLSRAAVDEIVQWVRNSLSLLAAPEAPKGHP